MRYCIIALSLLIVISPCVPSSNSGLLSGFRQPALAGADTALLHPNFDLTFPRLNELIPELSFSAERKARRFLSLANGILALSPDFFRLVDKTHPLEPEYEPRDLKTLSPDDFHVSKDSMRLDTHAYSALLTMTKAAARRGVALKIASAYRSYDDQKKLFDFYVKREGRETAMRFSAPAGSSQHQLGTAVDFGDVSHGFSRTHAWSWLAANARIYGWSLSYPDNAEEVTGYIGESWHWRWIGIDAAMMQFEFFDDSQQRFLEFWNRYGDVLAASRLLPGR